MGWVDVFWANAGTSARGCQHECTARNILHQDKSSVTFLDQSKQKRGRLTNTAAEFIKCQDSIYSMEQLFLYRADSCFPMLGASESKFKRTRREIEKEREALTYRRHIEYCWQHKHLAQKVETCKACYFHIRALPSHSYFSHYWGFKNHSCSNSWLSTWFLQLSPSWHIRFKSDSPSACSEYSCSSCRTKTSVLPHYACSLGFALASGLPQN